MDAQQAVINGMAWLDEHYPGWRSRIRSRISISSESNCALGQASGVRANVMFGRLGMTFDQATELGFWAKPGGDTIHLSNVWNWYFPGLPVRWVS